MTSAWMGSDAAATTRIPRSVPARDPSTTAAPAPVRSTLDHLGVPVADPDDLVATVLPVLRAARSAGHPVTAIAGRRTVGLVREALDDGSASGLVSLSPAEVLRPGPDRLIAALSAEARDAARRGRRAVVLLEYPATAAVADVAEWEAACSLVLADRPLTLLCGCARGAHPDALDGVVTHHPALLEAAGRRQNDDHRPPVDRSPSPLGLWGRRALHFGLTGVTGGDDLDRLRTRVARTAAGAGFDDEAADAAVRAAEDAAGVAAEAGDRLEVELRVHARGMLVDITGPGGGTAPARTRLAAPPGGAAAVHDDGATRRARVLLSKG